ncbi:ferredoxin [Candidatus Bathyarchaeota archaeon]|nr:MAG: ferredoxin [Candidatus Bathyarchaeota archaeon]
MPTITIDYEKCTFCQTCVSTCPMGVYEVQGDKVVVAHPEECVVCRACEASCPNEAITVEE